MNLLFLSHRLPFPPNKGDKIRSHALFAHLAAKHRIYLGCFVDEAGDTKFESAVREMAGGDCMMIPLTKHQKLMRSALALPAGSSITAEVYRSSALQRWVNDTLRNRQIDGAVVFGSAMAPYLLSGKFLPLQRVLFDMVDLDSDKWRQYSGKSGLLTSWIYRREASKLLDLERLAAAKFAQTYLVSPYEALSFSQMAPESSGRIKACSNGVNMDYFAPGAYPSPFAPDVVPIVMTGRMDYWPNVEGAIWFAREVLPSVRQRIPEAKFYVVGAQPTPALREIGGENVIVTGEVSDIRPYISAARAVVAPLRIARGVQNKVLEAMAMGIPTVATGQASRALNVQSGRDLWIANDPQEFCDAVVEATQTTSRATIGANGRSYVEQHHNWGRLLSIFDSALQDLSGASCREDMSHQGI